MGALLVLMEISFPNDFQLCREIYISRFSYTTSFQYLKIRGVFFWLLPVRRLIHFPTFQFSHPAV